MTDEKKDKYPLEASRQGDNCFTHGCEVYGGHRHYAMCLKVIGRIGDENSPMKNYDSVCAKAIAQGPSGCPALALRAKEELAGHSLYYVPREVKGLPPIPKDQIFSQSFERGYKGNSSRPPRGPDREIPSRPMGSSLPTTRSKPSSAFAAPKVKRSIDTQIDTTNLHGALVNKLMKEEGK